MSEELLKLQNIYKNFGNVKVLKDVNIKINKGEVVALIGDNGAGKSTLIKVITGVHKPSSGEVFFNGEEVVIKSVSQSRKMGIEAVYQERALCDQQELWRNIFAGREIIPEETTISLHDTTVPMSLFLSVTWSNRIKLFLLKVFPGIFFVVAGFSVENGFYLLRIKT